MNQESSPFRALCFLQASLKALLIVATLNNMNYFPALACLAGVSITFPFVANLDEIKNRDLLPRQQVDIKRLYFVPLQELASVSQNGGYQPGGPAISSFNPNHQDAVSVNDAL